MGYRWERDPDSESQPEDAKERRTRLGRRDPGPRIQERRSGTLPLPGEGPSHTDRCSSPVSGPLGWRRSGLSQSPPQPEVERSQALKPKHQDQPEPTHFRFLFLCVRLLALPAQSPRAPLANVPSPPCVGPHGTSSSRPSRYASRRAGGGLQLPGGNAVALEGTSLPRSTRVLRCKWPTGDPGGGGEVARICALAPAVCAQPIFSSCVESP